MQSTTETVRLSPMQVLKNCLTDTIQKCREMNWLSPLAHARADLVAFQDAEIAHAETNQEIAVRAKSAETADWAALKRVEIARSKLEAALSDNNPDDTQAIRIALADLKAATAEIRSSAACDRSIYNHTSEVVDEYSPFATA